MKKHITSLVLIFLFGWSFGCNTNPVQVQDQKSSQVNSTEQQARLHNVQLLAAPAPSNASLYKKHYSGDWFRAASGGDLTMRAAYATNNQFRLATFTATFTVEKNALARDTYIMMSFDDSDLKIEFGPEGLQFSTPATLNYTATGVDLSSVPDGAVINLYYVNNQDGSFEQMQSGTITYDKDSGTITCVDGRIPHFSEYAFGYIKK